MPHTHREGYFRDYHQVRKKNPVFVLKSRVRSITRYLIKAGKLKKGVCEVCGSEKTQAHHKDYSNPYDVRWLCRFHHGLLHKYAAV